MDQIDRQFISYRFRILRQCVLCSLIQNCHNYIFTVIVLFVINFGNILSFGHALFQFALGALPQTNRHAADFQTSDPQILRHTGVRSIAIPYQFVSKAVYKCFPNQHTHRIGSVTVHAQIRRALHHGTCAVKIALLHLIQHHSHLIDGSFRCFQQNRFCADGLKTDICAQCRSGNAQNGKHRRKKSG